MTDRSLTTLQYGGGQQSTALLVIAGLTRTGELPDGIPPLHIDAALFDNVGDDSEAPETLQFVREIAIPWAREHGQPLHVLQKEMRDGTPETVLGRVLKPGGRSHVIPIKLANGNPGGRSCTVDFKIKVSAKWLQEHGASEENPATVHMGISLEEVHRATTRKPRPYEKLTYRLLDMRWRRENCNNLVRQQRLSDEHAAHLRTIVDDLDWFIRDQLVATDCRYMPIPPPSSCWFCPSRPFSAWATLRAERPDRFEKVAKLEQQFIDREAAQGKPPVYFSNAGAPITVLADPGIQLLPLDRGDEGCDSGWCMT